MRKTPKPVKREITPGVFIDPELSKYNGVSLFPEKLAQAKEDLKKYPVPKELLKRAQNRK